METFIVIIVVALAVIYLVKRYLRIFRPREEAPCDGGCSCSGCGEASSCTSDLKAHQPPP